MDWRKKIDGLDDTADNMDWLQKMNRAIEYIEDNLLGEIDYDYAARQAYCSAHHFQRMFAFITGTSISEYIRRRRLTIAAFELQNTNAKVIDIVNGLSIRRRLLSWWKQPYRGFVNSFIMVRS